MISNKWKLATALGVVGAIAFSVASADARTKRNPANARGAVVGTVNGGADAYKRPFRKSYNSYGYRPSNSYNSSNRSTGYFGSGTFSSGQRVPGTNFNPNGD